MQDDCLISPPPPTQLDSFETWVYHVQNTVSLETFHKIKLVFNLK